MLVTLTSTMFFQTSLLVGHGLEGSTVPISMKYFKEIGETSTELPSISKPKHQICYP